MKIYIDSSNLLHIDERIYSDKVSLVFLRKGTTRFDIREVNTNNTILGKEVDIDIENVVNESGITYTTVDTIFTAIQSKLTNSISVLDLNGNVVSPSGVPYSISLEITRPADVIAYTALDTINSSVSTPVSFEFEQMAINNGGGGFLMDVKIETNITEFAGKNFRVWLYSEASTTPIGDNIAFTNSYVDRDKLIGFVDVEMETLLTGSDSVVGQVSTMKLYKCADTSLFMQLMLKDGATPTSGGKIAVTLNVLKL